MFWEIQLSTKAWRLKRLFSSMSFLYWCSELLAVILHGDNLIYGFYNLLVRSHYLGTGCQDNFLHEWSYPVFSVFIRLFLYHELLKKHSCPSWSSVFLVPGYHLYYFKSLSFYLKYRFSLHWNEHSILYFVNSFLIATIFGFNCHKLNFRDMALPVDPFVNWKCCFIPLILCNFEQIEKPISVIICWYVTMLKLKLELIILQIGKEWGLGKYK